MNYLALSDMWRLDRALKLKSTNGNTQIVPNSQSRILARTRQVFPLTLFPDEIIVEELRIVWLRKNGPWSYEVVSIMATDIASVNAASGPFFGHVHVQSLTGGPEILVDNLSRKNVYTIRSLVEGIAMSAREGLAVENANIESERRNLMQAGQIN